MLDGRDDRAIDLHLILPCLRDAIACRGGGYLVVQRLLAVYVPSVSAMEFHNAIAKRARAAQVGEAHPDEFGKHLDSNHLSPRGLGNVLAIMIMRNRVCKKRNRPTGTGPDVKNLLARLGLQQFQHECDH